MNVEPATDIYPNLPGQPKAGFFPNLTSHLYAIERHNAGAGGDQGGLFIPMTHFSSSSQFTIQLDGMGREGIVNYT